MRMKIPLFWPGTLKTSWTSWVMSLNWYLLIVLLSNDHLNYQSWCSRNFIRACEKQRPTSKLRFGESRLNRRSNGRPIETNFTRQTNCSRLWNTGDLAQVGCRNSLDHLQLRWKINSFDLQIHQSQKLKWRPDEDRSSSWNDIVQNIAVAKLVLYLLRLTVVLTWIIVL